MRGLISAPRNIITGAFNIRFAFQREVDLRRDDVVVTPIEGDALGHTKDTFGGGGTDYHILCYLTDAIKGRSRISVIKDGVTVRPVFIEYDTVKVVIPMFGQPVASGSTVEIPLSLDTAVQHLKKRNFAVSYPTQYQLYGTGDTYFLVIPKARDQFTVKALGRVVKANGVEAEIEASALEVDHATFY